jgi:hypothetical protein
MSFLAITGSLGGALVDKPIALFDDFTKIMAHVGTERFEA